MAEPARKPDSDYEPYARPKFGVINGGGETTDGRADLDVVKNLEENPENIQSDDDPISKLEDTPSNVAQGPWENHTTPDGNKKNNLSFRAKLSNNKKWLIGGGIGVGGIGIPLIMLSLLPLKLEMYIKNITNLASAVPQYATEQRLDYLITRALATRLLMKANGTAIDDKLVFCKSASISCSLMATYTTDYYEKKLGITLDVDAQGRTSLGGKASSWKVGVDPKSGSATIDISDITKIEKEITSNGEMKALIKEAVHSKTKPYQIISRFLGRKMLMKKWGVTSWRGPPFVEKSLNSLSEAKTNIKASLYKNTIGKISPRLATYLACIQANEAVCAKLRDKFNQSVSTPEPVDPRDDPKFKLDSPDSQVKLAEYNDSLAERAIGEGITELGSEVGVEAEKGALQKIISSKIIKVAGGVGAAAGVLDLIFGAINSLDKGALEAIWYDMSTQVYTGFATDIITINDKMKAGDIDSDTLAAASSLFDNVENSALFQTESGLPIDTSKGIVTQCNGPDGTKVNTTLAPGQLVCDDQKIVRDYSSAFTNNPAWSTLAGAAKIWKNSIGEVLKFTGDLSGNILNTIPGFKPLMDQVGSKAAPAISWIVSLIFDPPATGYAETGQDNYLALDGGIRTTQNALFEEGVDSDGTAMGGGGQVLTNNQILAINSDSSNAERDYFNNQPLMARLFSPDLTGSLAQQFILKTPTSLSGLARLPFSFFSQIFAGSSVSAQTTSASLNPFNLPIYGYPSGDPALTADPSIYTEDYCATSKKARDDSFYKLKGELVATYHKSDPCALEKMVVGSALNSQGITNDPYSLQDPSVVPVSTTPVATATSTPGSLTIPTGTIQELAKQIMATGNVVDRSGQINILASGAPVPVGNTDPRILGIILALAQSGFKFNTSSMARNYVPTNGATNSWHLEGRAVDISGSYGINGQPFNHGAGFVDGLGYGGGVNSVALDFATKAASYLPDGCQIGVPNNGYIDALKPLAKSGCTVFVDQGTGAHIHLGVPK